MTESMALDVIDKALTALDPHIGPDDRAKLTEAIVIVRDALHVRGRTVHDYVVEQPGLAHVTVLDDHALLAELVRTVGFGRMKAPRWSHVGACLGHGSGVSFAICNALALDPNELVGDDVCEHCGDTEEP